MRLRYSQFLMISLLIAGILVSAVPVRVHAICPSNCRYVPFQYPTIQAAINAATVNDTILVSEGTYQEHVMVNKTVHLLGSAMATTIIDGQSRYLSVVTLNATGASITGFTVENSYANGKAIRVFRSNNVNITGNTLGSGLSAQRPVGGGVYVLQSNRTVIDNNVFTYNLYGVNMSRANSIRVSNNRMVSSNEIGVEMVDSSNNTIFQNAFVAGREGLDMTGSLTSRNNITRNLVRGMNVTGVFLLGFPNRNVFNENTFELNNYAVDIQNSTGNVLFHNSFFRSVKHVNHVFAVEIALNSWDNRSFAVNRGGNYWDNYTGVDLDSDGIGDTLLPASGLDRYPLMVPFVPVPLAVAGVKASKMSGLVPLTVSFTADVLGTLKPFTYSWSFGDRSSLSNATSPTHTFSAPGNYTVSVLVKDSSNTYSLGSVTVTVVSPGSSGLNTGLVALAVLVAGGGLIGLVYYLRRRSRGSGEGSGESVKSSGAGSAKRNKGASSSGKIASL